ncbi:MAG: hypothetical protein A2655_00555 [Candidatus Yanofskybacteria bacterium RIFCSPHIGHO2_01_FULL_43_42]|uniref:EfeO-type cupredoxin-like domain-containing protein n=1 Tax=Candidatus Yanofskybacteria bacterium RIFCSPLOWO2_01_FULL_43_22 TaxID=1802695 RepID=A0A1F8GFV2_9BACT|nr:MAG: hypothetical protein A2655_00555 [Candidatus Yanofskybacteria bacterium RIFCSPHIGHO2_01_FULL_43_42]OGN13746.1 MAG: hypothetical protein A3D48_00305 [Candidatus Yanofskybacteria bacterium RIFCSPHIGHO2_02_FULL_43_17]OGN24265.1 MAG: hypothetical protein A3A13_03755 [Candidatus Yanofskybacteria bacterium RIFCSPLOWO2_01_FULL_43_22]
MNKAVLLTTIVVILIGITVFVFVKDTKDASRPPLATLTPTPTTEEASTTPTPAVSKTTVTYSDSGYNPTTVTIKSGDIVVFKNSGSKIMWTASAAHPTHNIYPGSGIEMCGTNTLVEFFDACRGYGLGESWEFRFDKRGTWKYHNHLQPSHAGTIIVE